MPHGNCFYWRPEILWLHAISDGLIAAAYYSIPLTLYFFIRKRAPAQIRALVLMFAAFILACGSTHLLSVWDIWHSAYRLEGVVKAITAALSVATALVAIRFAPTAVKLVSPETLEASNRALLQEVTARTRAEELSRRLMESERLAGEAKIRSYFEAASQAILAVSSEGRIELVNRRTEEMFGYTRAELIGQPLEMLVPQAQRAAHGAHRAGYFRDPRVRAMGADLELAGVRKDGTGFPVEIGLSYVGSGAEMLALGLVSDITERKRAEKELIRKTAELSASEAQLRSFLEAAPEAIVAVSSAGRVVLVNRSTEEMFGYSREELLGAEIELLIPGRFRNAHARERAAFFAEPRRRRMEVLTDVWGRRRGGSEFPVEVGLSYVETENGTLALALVTDVTERRRAADELAGANEQLRRSNAELEQFAYLASHDLQEPLRMITSYLRLLERRSGENLDQDGKDFIRYAVDGAERMKRLIRDFLSVSRISRRALHLAPASAGAMLEDALTNLQAGIEESGAQIRAEPLPVIPADAGLLTQVFQNLVGNAIKFHGADPPAVNISAEFRDAEWVFCVRDNGIGIEARHADRIFQIFERLHEAGQYSGSGIGLAICKKIVERHGGRIWLESERGAGAAFYFSIPAKAEAGSSIATAP